MLPAALGASVFLVGILGRFAGRGKRDAAGRGVFAELGEGGDAAYSASLFRKTSCAVSFVHDLPDYNGHVGIRELCDICPRVQLDCCLRAQRVPTAEQLRGAASVLPEARDLYVIDITERAAVVCGLPDEQPRYYLQHALGFQVHDVRHPGRVVDLIAVVRFDV